MSFFISSKLYGVTVSGKVMLVATSYGTPSCSRVRFGSGVMTVLDEKSTLFPIRFPLRRPSLPLSLALSDRSSFPDLCFYFGYPQRSLSMRVAVKNYS